MSYQAPSPMSGPTCGYRLEGVWLRAESDHGAVVAWRIDDGVVGDVDVSGVVFVIARRPERDGAHQVAFIDERVAPEQLHRLLDAFQGRLGQPFDRHGDGVRDFGFYQVPILYERDRRGERVSVLNRVEIVVGPSSGEETGPGSWQPRAAVAVSELRMAWDTAAGTVARRPFRLSWPEPAERVGTQG